MGFEGNIKPSCPPSSLPRPWVVTVRVQVLSERKLGIQQERVMV